MKDSLLLTTALGTLLLAGCSVEPQPSTETGDAVGGVPETAISTVPPGDGDHSTTSASGAEEITVNLQDAEGATVGTVTFAPVEGGTMITANVSDLTPGFHGFHIHETAVCDPDAAEGPFMSAGGHWNPGGVDHGEHVGDLPTLFANEDGTAELTTTTDAFTVEEITADSGRAVMVHAGRDNQANIPQDRYTLTDDAEATTWPDDITRRTGDAGARVACGEVSR